MAKKSRSLVPPTLRSSIPKVKTPVIKPVGFVKPQDIVQPVRPVKPAVPTSNLGTPSRTKGPFDPVFGPPKNVPVPGKAIPPKEDLRGGIRGDLGEKPLPLPGPKSRRRRRT